MTRECAKCGHRNCNHSYLEATGLTVDDRKYTPEGYLIDDSGLFKSKPSVDTIIAIIERRIEEFFQEQNKWRGKATELFDTAWDKRVALQELLTEIQALKEDKCQN
jgi:hypothetical protein